MLMPTDSEKGDIPIVFGTGFGPAHLTPSVPEKAGTGPVGSAIGHRGRAQAEMTSPGKKGKGTF